VPADPREKKKKQRTGGADWPGKGVNRALDLRTEVQGIFLVVGVTRSPVEKEGFVQGRTKLSRKKKRERKTHRGAPTKPFGYEVSVEKNTEGKEVLLTSKNPKPERKV